MLNEDSTGNPLIGGVCKYVVFLPCQPRGLDNVERTYLYIYIKSEVLNDFDKSACGYFSRSIGFPPHCNKSSNCKHTEKINSGYDMCTISAYSHMRRCALIIYSAGKGQRNVGSNLKSYYEMIAVWHHSVVSTYKQAEFTTQHWKPQLGLHD